MLALPLCCCRDAASSTCCLAHIPGQGAASPPLPWRLLEGCTLQYARLASGALQLWAASPDVLPPGWQSVVQEGMEGLTLPGGLCLGARSLTREAAARLPQLPVVQGPPPPVGAVAAADGRLAAASGGAGGGSGASSPRDDGVAGGDRGGYQMEDAGVVAFKDGGRSVRTAAAVDQGAARMPLHELLQMVKLQQQSLQGGGARQVESAALQDGREGSSATARVAPLHWVPLQEPQPAAAVEAGARGLARDSASSGAGGGGSRGMQQHSPPWGHGAEARGRATASGTSGGNQHAAPPQLAAAAGPVGASGGGGRIIRVLVACPPRHASPLMRGADLEMLVGPEVYQEVREATPHRDTRVWQFECCVYEEVVSLLRVNVCTIRSGYTLADRSLPQPCLRKGPSCRGVRVCNMAAF